MKKLFITMLLAVLAASSFAQSATEQQAMELAKTAKLYLEARNDVKGLEAAEKALALDSFNIDACMLKAVALSNLKRFDEAIRTATTGIKLEPGNQLLYSLRAYV